MSEVNQVWTLDSLKTELEKSPAFEPGEITVKQSGQDVLEITLESVGQITLYMTVSEHQILTSVLLWPRENQDDAPAFETMMLRNHKKLLPLCALAIENIGGRDYYELFGAMSSKSTSDSVVTEIRTLANNAIELAQDVGPNASAV